MKRLLKIFGVVFGLLIIAFFAFRTADTDPAQMQAKYGAAPSQFVILADGQKVHLRDEGPRDALPIILLHGSSSDLHTWQPWAESLRDQYRVIRFDQIGHGLTGPAVGETYRLEDFVEGVDMVADHLGLEQFVLGGNSMGGWISAGYAIEHPERLAGLILVDASGSPVRRREGSGGNIGFTIAGLPVINKVMESITPRSLVQQSLEQSVSNQEIVTDDAVDRYWEMLRYPGNRTATIARFNTERVTYDAEQIAALSLPTLVMWGDEDRLVPVEAGRWYDEHLPNSVLVEYPGIGHLPMEETPERSVNDLKNWIEQEVARDNGLPPQN